MKKGKYKYLFGNMALFTIGNFVSKMLVMLLVPFYTNVLTTSEYGVADVMQATLLLLVPLVTLNIGEAALRFGIERVQDRRSILKIGLKYIGLADLFVGVVCCVLAFFISDTLLKGYAVLFFLLFLCNSLYEFMILYCQGSEQVKIMISGSIFSTLLVILSNLFFLLVLRIGLYGYLYSQMLAFLGAALLMLVLMKKRMDSQDEVYSNSTQVKELEEEMTYYGKSMLLYSTSSWVNNAIDRYFVLAMCGSAVNGLYGVAYKIPAILIVLQRIFAQAWQMSATKNYKEKDRSEFFSIMYQGYQMIMVLGCSVLILFVRIIARVMFAGEFYDAWKMVPPLLISVIFGALTGFLGSICLAFKDGKSMGRATGAGALVNIVLNAVGIYMLGAVGAAIATMISYFVMYFYAFQKVEMHVKLHVSRERDYFAYLLLLIEACVMMLSIRGCYLISIGIVLMLFILYGQKLWKGFRK